MTTVISRSRRLVRYNKSVAVTREMVSETIFDIIRDNNLCPNNFPRVLNESVVLKDMGVDSLDTVEMELAIEDYFDRERIPSIVSRDMTVGQVIDEVLAVLQK